MPSGSGVKTDATRSLRAQDEHSGAWEEGRDDASLAEDLGTLEASAPWGMGTSSDMPLYSSGKQKRLACSYP